nr:ABC-three component system protein [uncultured Sphaerochaeta sp.]
MANKENKHAAAEQYVGYLYQSRFALYYLLDLDDDSCELFIERNDDFELLQDGTVSLASLKHRSDGTHLTDLSVDFWKSINIWIDAYNKQNKLSSNLKFLLFTTASASSDTFLNKLIGDHLSNINIVDDADSALSRTESKLILEIKKKYDRFSEEEKMDFFARVQIVDSTIRIENIAEKIQNRYLKTAFRQNRKHIYHHFLGWWESQVLDLLTGKKTTSIKGFEVTDKLASIASQYHVDDLPINFQDATPSDIVSAGLEKMMFVKQLQAIQVAPTSIQYAILDYFRACEQRSLWAREKLLIDDDLVKYENKLEEEWRRYKDALTYKLSGSASEDKLRDIGHALYNWAQFESQSLRIRTKVTEEYVRRGHFHILANEEPTPRIYWHPLFLDRIATILGGPIDGTVE